MPRVLNDLKIMLLANLWIVPVVAALVWALFHFVAPPPPMSASLATGTQGGAYRQFAERLKEELAKEGFELNLVTSSGSRDNLQRLLADNPEVQIALVQSGLGRQLSPAEQGRLHSLGAIYQEPLWLFYRRDVALDRITDLLSLRLGLGGDGSGTRAASDAILGANAIAPAQYPEAWQSLGGGAAARALTAGELDAAFFVGPAENNLVQQLAANPAIALAHFRRAAAYEARLPFFNRVTVGEGLLDLASNAPDRDTVTLAPVATLVINDDFNPGLVPLFLAASREVMKNGTLLDAAGAFPSAEPRTFELHPDAERYYAKGLPILQRYLPFRIASLADRYIILLIPLIVIMIPLFKAVGPIYQWRIRARIYRWYKHLREIDRKLHAGSLPTELDSEIDRLERLEDELAKVDVPLSYSNELYELHMHLRYVIERLRTLQQRRQ
ncbi:MAG: C4-dicarboxylate ABC transporter substrate-binding protein [Gammaproteobacteria bacterium]|nr:C4-dicarboxylate ABC transporter substrate-binding protein [Gammaproteobacteria bacterium]MBU1489460.1 C4-dicarboxylate ABC transporter substrate-binding protein [Gammaproteobacteria bacterium]MBU2137953.1 C4-dicarboxylate ABC transporter substrate-binding protein [Gammaproteobacteria bacterium]MBU2215932.1 C4-dicarboxylate ABC transporter substrate-binding protein [Gammaproteobacteria bacterium]MBU2322505.1 C4-dicarboxylate ABC transporter substrate-binding protein [Gammaproteobacteria bact